MFDASAKEGTVFEYDENDEPYPGDFSKDMTVEGSTPAFMQKDPSDFRTRERIRAQMLENEAGKKIRKNKSKLIAIIIPIVLVIALIFVVRAAVSVISGGKGNKRQVETTTTEVETTMPVTTEPIETEPPTPAEAGYYRVTGDLVKVRDVPSTENSKVLATVNKDATVMVKQFYNNDWALIAYEGKDAYISRKYIKKADDLNAITRED